MKPRWKQYGEYEATSLTPDDIEHDGGRILGRKSDIQNHNGIVNTGRENVLVETRNHEYWVYSHDAFLDTTTRLQLTRKEAEAWVWNKYILCNDYWGKGLYRIIDTACIGDDESIYFFDSAESLGVMRPNEEAFIFREEGEYWESKEDALTSLMEEHGMDEEAAREAVNQLEESEDGYYYLTGTL